MEFLLCADLIEAQRAYDMGLLNAVVPREQLLDAAYGFARRMTANAPLAVKATKQSALQGLYHDEDTTKQLRTAVRALRAALLTVEPGNGETASAALASAADILEVLGKDLRTAFEKESRLSSAIFQTEDAREGPKAFAEKRPPIWRGR